MRIAHLLSTATEEVEQIINPYLNSVTSGATSVSLGEMLGNAIIEAIVFIAHKIEPIIDGGLRLGFIIYVVSAIFTGDKKSAGKALRILLIYISYYAIMGGV